MKDVLDIFLMAVVATLVGWAIRAAMRKKPAKARECQAKSQDCFDGPTDCPRGYCIIHCTAYCRAFHELTTK